MKSLFRVGDFRHIYDPSIGERANWYINDHCFVRGEDGLWHMFGITHAEPAAPLDEKFLAHATAQHLLDAPWRKQAHVLPADPAAGETHVWAPHVIRHEGRYWMFYCGGGADHAHYRIHLAQSDDLWTWRRHPANPMVVDGFDARDPMILRVDDIWVMYYTGNSEPTGGHHVVYAVTSRDLVHWSGRREVFRHAKTGTYGGPTESPFVVRRGDQHLLFACTNDPYSDTAVYASRDPYRWDAANQVGSFASHAAEVIVLDDGATYVSRAGWGQGGLYLAPLHWNA
jgi:sucrose-6-phosphate hydrolase SacC (GH32 family)